MVGIVLAVPAANAQDLAAADQYTPSGGGGGGQNPAGGGGGNHGGAGGAQNPTGGGGAENPAGGGGAVSPAGDGGGEPTATVAEKGGGSLPFTGYPLTPLLWIIIGLVVVGIGFRLVSTAVRRGGVTVG